MLYLLRGFFLVLMMNSVLLVGRATACDIASNQLPKYIALADESMLTEMAKLYHLDTQCSGDGYAKECVEATLSPKITVLPIFPTYSSEEPFGLILIRYSPGESINSSYIPLPSSSGYIHHFIPDMYDSDWGYGLYFHQTVLEQNGDWYRINIPISAKTGWVQVPDARIISFTEGDFVTLENVHYVITNIQEARIIIRKEQNIDMECEKDNNIPLNDNFSTLTLPLTELYDKSCALMLKPTYTRGC